MKSNSIEKKLAFLNLGFAIFIILWGAWVRLSGSGAGCGDHWPLCNGEVIPSSMQLKTIIEFTHRLTSGLFGFTILGFVILAFKKYSAGHPIRSASIWALGLTLIEALIGAVLVKKGLVVDNSSWQRALVIGIHLINTLFLLFSLVACAYFSSQTIFTKRAAKRKEQLFALFIVLVFLFVGGSGAITALGNTLFPETSLAAGIAQDFNSSSHFLIRLRIYHPLAAICLFFLLLNYSKRMSTLENNPYARPLLVLSFIGVGFGVINWLLMAPVWGALIHLFLADLIWMTFSLNYLFHRYQKS